jgi:hypothetical protein
MKETCLSALGDKLFALQQQVERQIGDFGASQAAPLAAPGRSLFKH